MLLGDEAYLGLSDIGYVEYLGEKSYPVKNCLKLCDVAVADPENVVGGCF